MITVRFKNTAEETDNVEVEDAVETVYTVTKFDEIDCYKRAETYSNVVGTFKSREDAERCLVKEYTKMYLYDSWNEEDMWCDIPARINAGIEWADLHADGEPCLSDLVMFFQCHADELWEPEYINETTFRVEITETTLS